MPLYRTKGLFVPLLLPLAVLVLSKIASLLPLFSLWVMSLPNLFVQMQWQALSACAAVNEAKFKDAFASKESPMQADGTVVMIASSQLGFADALQRVSGNYTKVVHIRNLAKVFNLSALDAEGTVLRTGYRINDCGGTLNTADADTGLARGAWSRLGLNQRGLLLDAASVVRTTGNYTTPTHADMSWNLHLLLRGSKRVQHHTKESTQCLWPYWVPDNAAPQLMTSKHRCQFYGSADVVLEEGDALFGPEWAWHTYHAAMPSTSIVFHGVSATGAFIKEPIITMAAILHRAKFRSLRQLGGEVWRAFFSKDDDLITIYNSKE